MINLIGSTYPLSSNIPEYRNGKVYWGRSCGWSYAIADLEDIFTYKVKVLVEAYIVVIIMQCGHLHEVHRSWCMVISHP